MTETPGPEGRARRAAFSQRSRIAFFGGSFDPPHNGHLAVARAARAALDLDRVLFAPVGVQPIKIQGGAQGATASFDNRLAMTRLAIAGEPGFEISLADAPSAAGTPNYSLETLARVRAELDWKLGAACRLFFLLGADAFLGLRQWHRAAEVPFAAEMVVASRPGQPLDHDQLQAALPEGLRLEPWMEGDALRGGVSVRGFRLRNQRGESAELYLLPGLHVEISASEIRRALAMRPGMGENASRQKSSAEAGAALEETALPVAVAEYIREHALYR